jgi:MFS family permease
MKILKKILRSKIALIDIAVLTFGFIDTFYIYIASSYFATVIASENVGFFYILSYSGSLALAFFLQPLIRTLGRSRTLYLFLLISLSLMALLTYLPAQFFSAVILLLFIVSSSVIWVVFDILLEGFSNNKESGRIRGLNLTFLNLGVLLAPVFSTNILTLYGYSGVFFVALVLYVALFIFCLFAFRDVHLHNLPKMKFWHTLTLVRRKASLWRAYILFFSLFFFYAVMIIYMPLRLLELHFSWQEIGSIFTLMLLPFIFIQYPLGYLADKRYGEKEMLLVSLALATLSTVVVALLSSESLVWWMVVLFVSRIGIAGLEVLKDTYFYRQIGADDVDIIAFFRTAMPLASIVATALSSAMLAFMPLSSVFWLAALVLFLAFISTIFLKDSRI